MQRIGFPPFKRSRRSHSPRHSARLALNCCSEPLEARMMLAGDLAGVATLETQSAYVLLDSRLFLAQRA